MVERIEDGSTQLAEALETGTPIIITTLQTFPFVVEKIAELPARNYAVIVDEAHSSQTGISAAKLKAVLGGWDVPVEGEIEEEPESGRRRSTSKRRWSPWPRRGASRRT